MPKVSIIVPAWNAQKTIGRCVDSIIKQTWTDFELLLMDDGSTDGTAEIIDRYAAQDARIRPVHKENTGVSDTRNRALSLAEGEYVQFLDADDWISPDATRLFVRAMEESPACDMIIADFYRVIDKRMAQKGDIDEERLITREEYAEYMKRNPADFYYGVLWNKFFRRSIIEAYNLRMDENLSWAEDFIFNMEYVLHTNKIYVLKVPVYYYVKTEGSLVAQNGMSISRTVQMKLNVIEYYSDFYKNIYTPESYLRRSPSIYAFLLNFAKDGSVNPVAPDRRLGRNRLKVSFSPDMPDNLFVENFYEERLLETAVEHITNGNGLEENDAWVVLYLELAGGTASVQEIRNFTGLSGRAVTAGVQRLLRREIVERVKQPRRKKSAAAANIAAAKAESRLNTAAIAGTSTGAGSGMNAAAAAGAMSAKIEGTSEAAGAMPAKIESTAAGTVPAEGGVEADMPAPVPNVTLNVAELAGAKNEAAGAGGEGRIVDSAQSRSTRLTFGPEAEAVRNSLHRAFRDLDELQTQGFTEEEKVQYRKLREKAAQNARRALDEA